VRRWPSWAIAAALAALLPQAAAACAVCYGADGSAALRGMNQAIFFLLGCVGLVFAGVGKLIWDIHRRTRRKDRFRLIGGGARP
jgi:hypothetical protein